MEFSNNYWSQVSQIMRNMTLAMCNSGMVIPMQHVLVSEKTQRDLPFELQIKFKKSGVQNL